MMLWFTALVFTIASFIWKSQLFFPLMAGLFWIATAYSTVQINFMGFGDINPIIYTHELDDWYGDVALFRLLAYTGIIHFIYAIYNGLMMSRHDIDNAVKRDTVLEDTRKWR